MADRPKLPTIKVLELIRKDFIQKSLSDFLVCVKDAKGLMENEKPGILIMRELS